MVYVACQVVSGTAELVDHEELAEIAWSDLQQLAERVPGGIFEPVQEYLNHALIHAYQGEAGMNQGRRIRDLNAREFKILMGSTMSL